MGTCQYFCSSVAYSLNFYCVISDLALRACVYFYRKFYCTAKFGYCHDMSSVYSLSLCLSVTREYWDKMTKASITRFSLESSNISQRLIQYHTAKFDEGFLDLGLKLQFGGFQVPSRCCLSNVHCYMIPHLSCKLNGAMWLKYALYEFWNGKSGLTWRTATLCWLKY